MLIVHLQFFFLSDPNGTLKFTGEEFDAFNATIPTNLSSIAIVLFDDAVNLSGFVTAQAADRRVVAEKPEEQPTIIVANAAAASATTTALSVHPL